MTALWLLAGFVLGVLAVELRYRKKRARIEHAELKLMGDELHHPYVPGESIRSYRDTVEQLRWEKGNRERRKENW